MCHRVANRRAGSPLVFTTQVSNHTETCKNGQSWSKRWYLPHSLPLPGKEYKRSFRIGDPACAKMARRSIELTIHRLVTGLVTVPLEVDPGDFILSGGTLLQPPRTPAHTLLSTAELVQEFLRTQQHVLASSSYSTAAMHLRHLERHLGDLAFAPCDGVNHRDLDGFLQARLVKRDPVTVKKER